MTFRCPNCGLPVMSQQATWEYQFMIKEAPKRGGIMWEGCRPAYDRGEYQDAILDELLAAGAIARHPDPNKGFVPVRPGVAA